MGSAFELFAMLLDGGPAGVVKPWWPWLDVLVGLLEDFFHLVLGISVPLPLREVGTAVIHPFCLLARKKKMG